MIYTAILEYKGSEALFEIPPYQNNINKRIEETKSERLKEERRIAYGFLLKAYNDAYGESAPTLFFEEGGKPYFSSESHYVSVSHTDGFCAVSFCENPIGVDVETLANLEEKSTVIKRFVNESLQKEIKNREKAEDLYMLYQIKNGDVIRVDSTECVFSHSPSLASWTALEAVLKCGGGFESYGKIDDLMTCVTLDTVLFNGAVFTTATLRV